MTQKICVLILALTLTATWSGKSVAESPATEPMLRVFAATVAPDQRDHLPEVIGTINRAVVGIQAVRWFALGSDPATGEIGGVALWKSQAAFEEFLKSDARKADAKKINPLLAGEPSAKNYQISSDKGNSQPVYSGQILRILTTTALPDKRDQLPKIVAEITQVLAATKGIQWFKVGSDPATGELASVTLWSSQAEVEAFFKSDARKVLNGKIRPLMQGEPSIKTYQIADTKNNLK